MTNRRRLQSRLEELLKQYDAEISNAFLAAIRRKADSINLVELTRAIEGRDFNRALNIAGITRADMFPLDAAITNAYVAGGQTIPAAAPAFAASFGFDGRATRAMDWSRDHVGGLVTNIVEEQLDMLRTTITRQISDGVAPRKVAIEIAGRAVNGTRQGGFIGLSNAQLGYLDNAKAELTDLDSDYFSRKLRDRRFDGIVRRAIKDSKPLSQADIDRISARYSDRMLKHRADTIARTESITALRAGRHEGIQQAIEQGAIAQHSVKRVWSATDPVKGGRTRDSHVDMDGQVVDGMNVPFVSPNGAKLLHPGDSSLGAPASETVACRCYGEYVVDWLRG